MRRRPLLAGVALTAVAVALVSMPTTNAQFAASTSHGSSWATKVSSYRPPVTLGVLPSFSVLGYTGVTNSGNTVLAGDTGVSPAAAISGFPPGIIQGATHLNDAIAIQAQTDLKSAYDQILAMTGGTIFANDLNGKTFTPGLYHTDAAFTLTGNLTFDAQNNPNANFIFQVEAAWNTAASATMTLKNGAIASHIFYQVLGAAGTGGSSSSVGSVFASGAINAGAGSNHQGQLLSRGLVTLSTNHVTP